MSDRADIRLGGLRTLEDLAWGGDYQGETMPTHYVNDYLLFPSFPRQSSHLMPAVADTWEPFFRRTVQALRGESPANAARWMGSLLHFVEDSGSPPHALPITGELHTRMENWVLPLDIRLPGYQPELLGVTEAEASAGVRRRVSELVAFSRERATRLRPLAEQGNRPACEPLVLECARETMRATADVAHTALSLAEQARPGTGILRGAVRAPVMAAFPYAPVRLVVLGTDRATCADLGGWLPADPEVRGSFVLGDLDSGTYRIAALRPGCRTEWRSVTIRAGRSVTWDLRLREETPGGNLVRNSDLSVEWLRPGQPDYWTRIALTSGESEWWTDAIRVEPGTNYRANVEADGACELRIAIADSAGFPSAARTEVPGPEGRFTPQMRFVQLRVHCREKPRRVVLQDCR